jgi:hypothetical protein
VPTTPKGLRCVIFFTLREEDGGDNSDGALTLAVVEELLLLRLLFRRPADFQRSGDKRQIMK